MGSNIFFRVIRRNLTGKSTSNFAGAWKDIGEKEIKEMKNNIKELRRRSTKELVGEYKRGYVWILTVLLII